MSTSSVPTTTTTTTTAQDTSPGLVEALAHPDPLLREP